MRPDLLERFAAVTQTIREPEQLRTYECDGLTGHRVVPALVALPAATAEVQAVVRLCARGADPVRRARRRHRALRRSAARRRRDRHLARAADARSSRSTSSAGEVVVEPGVANLDVTRAVADDGFYYAPDPSSQQVCTIGGNVAENSGGAHCLKYGFTVNHVLAAEIVLPDGELVELSVWDDGPDLLGAFVGSEGTLGIATKLTLRDPARARGRAHAARRLRAHRRRGRRGLRRDRGRDPARGDRDDGRGHDGGGRGGGRRELSGRLRRGADRRARRAGRAGRGGSRARRGDLPRERRARDPHRVRSAPTARPSGAAARRRSPRWAGSARTTTCRTASCRERSCRRCCAASTSSRSEHGLRVGNVFHAGDGNLHPLVLYDGRVEGEAARAEELSKKILEVCIDAGGSITGEHGVGTDKACAMPLMFGEDDLAAMQRLRRAFDPRGLANPGQALPDAAALRRGAGPVPRAPTREGRACRPVLTILEHEPGDLTCIVEGGIRLSVLCAALAEHGQRLSLDPPGDPTLAECLLDDLSGPLRHRFGDDARPRDRRHGRAAGRDARELGRQGREERRGLRPRASSSAARAGGSARVERLALRLHPLPAAARTVVDARGLAGAAPVAARAERGRPRRRDACTCSSRDRSARSTRRRARSAARRPSRGTSCARCRRELPGRVRWDGEAAPLVRPGPRVAYVAQAREPAWSPLAERVRGGDVQPELIADCVHCGFCLPTCPTYSLWHEEMDSPRGRIYLMQGLVDGSIALTDTVVEHFDRCLGCMACVTSCPSGVQYDRLIEQTRDYVEEHHRRGRSSVSCAPAIFAVVPAPAAAARRAALPQAAGARAARAAEADRAAVGGAGVAARASARRRPEASRVLAGCVASVVFGDVNAATARVLHAEGYDVHVPRAQGCCGALHAHARAARARASRVRGSSSATLAGYDYIVTNAAGCGSHLKDHGVANVVDVSELLAEPRRGAAPAAAARRVPGLVPSSPCAGRRRARRARCSTRSRASSGSSRRSRRSAAAAPGSTTSSRRGPRPSSATARPAHVLATRADAYASGNPGLPRAGDGRAAPRGPADCRRSTRSSSSTRRSAGSTRGAARGARR